MFAMTFHADVAEHDHVVIAFDFFKGALKHFHRIFGIANAEFFPCARYAAGGANKPFTCRVITSPAQQDFYSGFGFFTSGSACHL